MRRIVIWFAATVTIVVLLFGYHTSTNRTSTTDPGVVTSPVPAASGGSGSAGSGASGSTSGGSGSGGSGSGTSKSSGTKTYTGSVTQTRWGPVQVKITVSNGKITNVDVLQHPDGNPRDAEINDYALPILVHETMAAQSADINMVSGATVTSDGYLGSLQSALDEAGI